MKKIAVLLFLCSTTIFAQDRFVEVVVSDTIKLKPVAYNYQLALGPQNIFGFDMDDREKDPEEEKKKRDRVAKALNDVFKNDIDIMDEVKPILVKSFAKVYTEKELKQMIDFYKSPTGKKMVSQSPKMTDIIYKRTLTEVAPKLDKALKLAIKEEVLDKRNAEKTE